MSEQTSVPRRLAPGLRRPIILVAAAALVLGLIAVQGLAPGAALVELWRGSIGSLHAWVFTLRLFAPLCLCGLAVAIAFRAGLWNIGAEGQLLVGAAASVAVGSWTGHWLPALVAGSTAGLLLATLPAVLRVTRGVPEVLSTIMLNFVALELVRYLVTGPLQEPTGQFPMTAALPADAMVPQRALTGAGTVHLGVPIAIALALALGVGLTRTRTGLLIRAVADSPRTVQAGSLPLRRTWLLAFGLSGALAGLAGALEVTGVSGFLDLSMARGTGYAAIAVALLAALRPLLVVPSALLFAALSTGTSGLQWVADLPGIDRFAFVVQGLAVLAVLLLMRDPGSSRGAS